MEYIILQNFKEFGVPNAPSLLEKCEKKPYQGQDKIVEFLKCKGEIGAVAAKVPIDVITGERIPGELVIKHYGKFGWMSDLAYHVEKYNLRLPKEFEDYVLSQDKKAV